MAASTGRMPGELMGPYKPSDPARLTRRQAQRIEAGLTQQEAAKAAGVSVRTWRRWERGGECPTADFDCRKALAARRTAPLWPELDD